MPWMPFVIPFWHESVMKEIQMDDELLKIYNDAYQESHAAGLKAVYEHGQKSVVLVNTTSLEVAVEPTPEDVPPAP
jgi:hypothetical protein